MRQDVNDEDDTEHERKHRAEVTKERRHDRAVVYEDQALGAGATSEGVFCVSAYIRRGLLPLRAEQERCRDGASPAHT